MGDANDDGLRPDRCETCRYWDQEFTTDDWGVCRRRAPAPVVRFETTVPDRYEQFPRWPLTLDDDWCGEWAAVPAPGT